VNADLAIAHAEALRDGPSRIRLQIEWLALRRPHRDYSVAIHLVRRDPPATAEDVIVQADAAHPVGGWAPTSTWQSGWQVADTYGIDIPPGAEPVAVRVTAYRQLPDGTFENGAWLSVRIPRAGR
jgi:hypothetical protein